MQWLRDVRWSTAAPRGTDNALGRAASGSPWRRPHSCTSVRILPEACGLAGPACVAQDADGKALASTCWRACPAVWADLQRFRPAGSSRKMPTAKSTLRGTDQGRDVLEKRGAAAMCANGARPRMVRKTDLSAWQRRLSAQPVDGPAHRRVASGRLWCVPCTRGVPLLADAVKSS